MRGGAEPVRETGPNGKDYVVKHEITLDVTEEATPEETAAKMDLIRQATDLMPAQTATEQIAATNALIEARARMRSSAAREKEREEKREYVSQPVERLTSPPAGQIVSTSLLKAQLTAANERPTIALSETEPSLYDIHAEPPFDPTIPLADTEPRQEREAAPSREDVLFDRVAGSRRRVEAQENTLLGQAERRDRAEVLFDERQVRRAEAHEVSKKKPRQNASNRTNVYRASRCPGYWDRSKSVGCGQASDGRPFGRQKVGESPDRQPPPGRHEARGGWGREQAPDSGGYHTNREPAARQRDLRAHARLLRTSSPSISTVQSSDARAIDQ